MAIKFNRSQTFATNGTVTSSGLHNLVDGLDIYQALITDQTELTNVATDDNILVADASLTAGDAPRKATVQNIFDDALTGGTFTNAQFSGIVTSGTTNSTRGVFANSTITTGTIPNLTSSTASITIGTIPALTAGTTTSTAANITNGTIQTLTSSTANITGGTFSGLLNSSTGTYSGEINSTVGTIATFNSTTGTIIGLKSTTGTISTLNSTTGTITNLSTTLAGDFTISQGTGTIGTAKVTPTNLLQPFTIATAVASTSGTAIDFIGIPSWVKRITVILNGVSTNGTSALQIQIGAGSITSSGYAGYATRFGTAPSNVYTSMSSGFVLSDNLLATTTRYGMFFIQNISSNNWNLSGSNTSSAATGDTSLVNGGVSLSGALDRVRVTTVNGTDTFDAGIVNIMYEG